GADLTAATFAHAHLKSTNFANFRDRPTTLTHVRWHHTQKLDRARLGTHNLQDPRVRTLLITLNGVDQDFTKADLRGANLAEAKLHRANLKGANLNGATLQGAELQGANLTAAQCVGTDFTAAHLTGACLEAWNIDSTTLLKAIDCQYVFLLEQPDDHGSRERRPHNPDKDFQPGDFEKFFKEMLDTVQILIRNGVNPESFKAALQGLMDIHPDLNPEAIRGFERKGDDVLVTLQVPDGTDKGEIESTWDEMYEARLQAATARAELEAERRRGDDVKEVALGFSKILSSLEIHNTAMTKSNNPSIKTGDGSVYAGGDLNLTGSTLNLGEISGQVSNQISQLPDTTPGTDQPSLKELLVQLQAAVEQDTELSEIEKKEALGEVAKLAEAGTQPQESAMQRMAKRATAALKSITEPLSEASKLANACKTLLPPIVALF
ncbi:MAG: pentapeptide repeat-containing protein, partial [Cyanobacteria bacterium J06626_18]